MCLQGRPCLLCVKISNKVRPQTEGRLSALNLKLPRLRDATHIDGWPGLCVLSVGIGGGRRRLWDGEARTEGGAADGARFGTGRAGGHGPLLFLRWLLLKAQADALEGSARAERPARAVELATVGAGLRERGSLGLQPGRGGTSVGRPLRQLRVAAAALEAGLGMVAGRLGIGTLGQRPLPRWWRWPGLRGRAAGWHRRAALRTGRLARRRHRRAALWDWRRAGRRGGRAALLGRRARGHGRAALCSGGLARGTGRRSGRRGG